MQIDSDFEFPLKVLVIGDSSVGKTNFIFRFIDDRFSLAYITTVGFDYRSKIITLPKIKKKVKLQIWDTAGQERYNAINKNLFQKVQGVILMYDITNRTSFENKLDLSDTKRIVTEDEGQNLVEQNDMLFFETSSKTGENVEKIFISMAQSIYENLSNDFNSAISGNDSIELTARKSHFNNKKKKECCK